MKPDAYRAARQKRIHTFLEDILPNQPGNVLHQAMRYAALNGGKRLRPLLVYATGEAFQGDLKALDQPAAAVECMHAFSLIHDDLPAMDNSDLRRGKPSCHKTFGEAIAILTGDALHTFCFEILKDHTMTHALAKAAFRVCNGQALDIKSTPNPTEDFLLELYRQKTAALLWASVQLGLIAAHCTDESTHHTLHQYATHIGLAFQIRDDILDIESNTKTLGKPPGKDQALGKITYPHLVGLDNAKYKVHQLHEAALQCLQDLHLQNTHLASLTTYLTTTFRL